MATKYFWGDEPDEAEYYASQGVTHAQSYFTTPSGQRLFTQSFHSTAASADPDNPKALVFMTHSFGSDTGRLFQKIAIAYATWGYSVHLTDLLGHGRSDGLPGYLGDLNSVASASHSFFPSVGDSRPARIPAFLFGESLGGLVTTPMYLQSPPGLWTGLILSAPNFVIPEDMKPSRVRLFLFGLLFGAADTWQMMPEKNMVGKAIRDMGKLKIIASNPRRYTGRPRVGTLREIVRMCEYAQANFSKVTAPFLVLHGTDDGVTAPEGSKMLYEKAASEDKELIMYDGMLHSLVEGEPEENSQRVLADMRKWIDERANRYGGGGGSGGGRNECSIPSYRISSL